MAVLFLKENDVRQLIDMPSAIGAMELAFRQLSDGNAANVPRQRAKGEGIVLHSMSAAAPYLNLVGWKQYTTTKTAAQFLVGLHEGASGALVAMMEANHLGQLRTGAVTGVAVSALAAADSHQLGLFGTGFQAETQLAAVCAVRKLRRVYVYSRSPERREAFARKMSAQLEIEIEPVDRPQLAVEELPIVVTATSSREPVFHGEDLAEGTLVCAVGSNWLNKAEIDTTTIRRADNVVCDSVIACQHEAGDFLPAVDEGLFDWKRAVDLGDVLTGRHVGRSTPQSIVLFKSVGLALEDVALGAAVLERARASSIGKMLEI